MELKAYLHYMITHEGSDLYLTAGAAPSIKINGQLKAIDDQKLSKEKIQELAFGLMDAEQLNTFQEKLEMNLALSLSGIGRFRVNIFQQRNTLALVIRSIKVDIPKLQDLGMPIILQELIMAKRGLILLVGATGSGKSTSLASLIDYRNSNSAGHIITIEDPIEFLHTHKKSIVNQREVGIDTLSYQDALKNTLRQAPDVILIGEIRSRDTMDYALAFAETGHLCLSTLHANNAYQALERIVSFFPKEQKLQILLELSLNLKAIISQRLIPTLDGKRIAAFETLLATPHICDLIKRGEIEAIKTAMEKHEIQGMQTFETALHQLYKTGKISEEEALRNADSEHNLKLRISLDEPLKDISTRFAIKGE
jgi:twitching motility protein PilU